MAISGVWFAMIVTGSNETPAFSPYFCFSSVFMKVVYSHITFLKQTGNNNRDDYTFQHFTHIMNDQLMFADQVVNWKVR